MDTFNLALYLFYGTYKGEKMKKESLEKAKVIIVDAILKSNIEETDKIELAMNIMTFLDNYKEHLTILQQKTRHR